MLRWSIVLFIGFGLSGCESMPNSFGNTERVIQAYREPEEPNSTFMMEVEELSADKRPVLAKPKQVQLSKDHLHNPNRHNGHSLPLVLFPFDSAELTDEARATLNEAASWLRTYLHGEVVIEGHTDRVGTEAYNLALGYQRAVVVMRYLEDLGVVTTTIQPTSYGELKPICPRDDTLCQDMNRRAYVHVANKTVSDLLTAFKAPASDHQRTDQELLYE